METNIEGMIERNRVWKKNRKNDWKKKSLKEKLKENNLMERNVERSIERNLKKKKIRKKWMKIIKFFENISKEYITIIQ